MTKKIPLPSNEMLLYILSTATAFTLTWALIFIDGGQNDMVGTALVVVRGLLVGGVSGLATAIVSNRAMRVKAKEPKQWALGSLAGMLGAELVIVSFVTYATMTPEMSFLWWPLRALVALCAGAFIPLISIGLASTGGALQAEAQDGQMVAQTEDKPAKKPKAGAQKEGELAQDDPALVQIAQTKQQETPLLAQVAQTQSQAGQVAQIELTDENLLAQYLRNPRATDTDLAQVFGKTRQTIGNRRNALESSGRIRKGGDGIKVLPVMVVQEQNVQ